VTNRSSSAPGGHYSQAIVHGGTVCVSGQLGRGPGMTDGEGGDIKAQTRDLHFVR
jgi:enamine deaminase RidA (YjgF/YER057c/UK114 family)